MRTLVSPALVVFLASPLWAQGVVPARVPPATVRSIYADINQMKALGQSDNAILGSLLQKWSPPKGRRGSGFRNNRLNGNRFNRIGNGNQARVNGNQVNGDGTSIKQREGKKAGRKARKRQRRLNRLNNLNRRQGKAQAGRRRQNSGQQQSC